MTRASRLTSAIAVVALLAACHGRHTPPSVAVTPQGVVTLPPKTLGPRRAADLATLVTAERGFARLAHDSGWYAAFLATLGDSATLFRPGPVNGRQWLAAHQPRERTGFLAWEPRVADVSAAGDLGYTVGPYELRLTSDADSAVSRGSYLTIWTRAPGSTWRVALDAGAVGPALWPVTRAGWGEWTAPSVDVPPERAPGAVRDALRDAEAAIGGASARGYDGLVARLMADARIFRQQRTPTEGRDEARRALGRRQGTYRAAVEAFTIARSGDLAMTWGSYQFDATVGAAEQGNFVRVWRRDAAGDWRVAVDLEVPVPGSARS